jgi:hypothetical protein
MNRALVLALLEQAYHQTAIGESNKARQREIIAELSRAGHDTAEAQQLLRRFEELQSFHIRDRDRLEKELAELTAEASR